ncbi:hypothetical protein MPSEU_000148700 [Mayamaea pseudoterrestris]|nr:hypothetical protein MPSEU_000148700 [Mayamaea pseudoterrestris]
MSKKIEVVSMEAGDTDMDFIHALNPLTTQSTFISALLSLLQVDSMIIDDHEEEERELADANGVRARFVTEQFTYFDPNPWSISISKAATATGGMLVSEDHDLTGVMLWPASHLMCQLLVQNDVIRRDAADENHNAHHDSSDTKYYVLELGSGCGLVSLVGILKSRMVDVWMATDVDANALELCRKNFAAHGFTENDGQARIRSLAWGDERHIQNIRQEMEAFIGGGDTCNGFDAIVGADIVYPDTNDETLGALFQTVDALLTPKGTFYLAFATRDGAKTPSRLVYAARHAGYSIDRLPALSPEIANKLPPLLDSKLLILRKINKISELDASNLGSESCAIFPGLWDAVERLENPSSDEEWQAPPLYESDEE